MKIILVNYRYFISGGPERYYFNIKEILERNGHVVIPFSVKNSRNFQVIMKRISWTGSMMKCILLIRIRRAWKWFWNPFHVCFTLLKLRGNSDNCSLTQIPTWCISCNIITRYHLASLMRQNLGIPVIHRISDFQYMCPNALFYNGVKGVCEECLNGNRWNCVRNKCVLNSTVYSVIKLGAKMLHDAMHITRKIDAFVVPSSFTLGKLVEYGISRQNCITFPLSLIWKREIHK